MRTLLQSVERRLSQQHVHQTGITAAVAEEMAAKAAGALERWSGARCVTLAAWQRRTGRWWPRLNRKGWTTMLTTTGTSTPTATAASSC